MPGNSESWPVEHITLTPPISFSGSKLVNDKGSMAPDTALSKPKTIHVGVFWSM